MKDRLIELLSTAGWNIFTDEHAKRQVADHLLISGVIVPPVKVGQTVYAVVDEVDHVLSGVVYEIVNREGNIFFRYIRNGYFTGVADETQVGKNVFLTREEAEKALEERSKE